MAHAQRLKLCASELLLDGGTGFRFEVQSNGRQCPAFAVRHEGKAYAYLNRCAHIGVELDWQRGQFFDQESKRLICATHGALYEPHSGKCVEGPCRGQSLTPVPVQEEGGYIYFLTQSN